ncbi:MAG: AbrB family transcriptional regulator [Pseudomonadota bacterium]
MIFGDLGINKRFLLALGPATVGGGLWDALGLPLGWLMGAAVVTGVVAMQNVWITVPKPLYNLSLALLGASVGLSVTPDVAALILVWAPVMVVVAVLAVFAGALMAPLLARWGRMDRGTAFFSLLPGGVIEMANVGDRYGADRTIVAALHAVRVALVVGVLPLTLFAFYDNAVVRAPTNAVPPPFQFALLCTLAAVGGWIADRLNLPAAWLLGALILVGITSSMGSFSGRIPEPLLAAVQVLVGISLGARFKRERLAAIPRALAAGFPVLLLIIGGMALAATTASLALPFSLPTLILCFSIGGMAEMVLTSKALGQNVALVVAFQAVRAVIVNAFAGAVWRRIDPFPPTRNSPKG